MKIKMESEFNEEYLLEQLKTTTHFQRIAFVVSCCERMYPNYTYFWKIHKWGNPKILRKALDLAWNSLCRAEISGPHHELIVECQKITPDTEDFDSIYVSSALDSAVSITMLLEILEKNSLEEVIQVASLACDTVDLYVQELENMNPNDIELEKKILTHPIMQHELKRQKEDLDTIQTLEFSSKKNNIKNLKKKWYMPKKSNIGLDLVI